MTTVHPLNQLAHWADTIVVADYGLREVAVHDGLGGLQGMAGDDAIAMRTRLFESERWARWLVARIDCATDADRPWSVTVIGLPRAVGLPIVGLDVIAMRGNLVLAAMDVHGTGHHGVAPDPMASWLTEVRADLGDAVVDRRRPEFAQQAFSPHAIIVGARAQRSDDALLCLARRVPEVQRFMAADAGLDGFSAGDEQGVRQAVDRWLEAERGNRREQTALNRLFGEEQATRYLAEVLLAPV